MAKQYYVTDTHALLWYLTDSPQLSRKARAVFEEAENGNAVIIVSAIVLLESIDIFDKKKLPNALDEILGIMLEASNFLFAEVNLPLILEVSNTKGFNDLHDRTLVATSRLFDAPLISKDAKIHKMYAHVIW